MGPSQLPKQDSAQPRATATKARLLEAALKLFAAHGFDGVTTRQLATEAGANVAAVNYHFGGKRELYHALIAQIVAETTPFMRPGLEALRAGIEDADGDRSRLSTIAATFIEHLVHGFLGDERMRLRAAIVLREHAQPTEAFSIFYEGRMKPLHEAVATLAGAATGRPADHPETIVRAQAVIGQVVIFVIAREVLFRRLQWESYTPERIDMVSRTVTTSVLTSLGLPLSAGSA